MGFTCVGSFVDLEVFRASEDFPAAGERTGKRLLSGVDPDVVDEFVLGFEGFPVPGTLLPEACVVGALGSPDVFDGDMCDDLVHSAKAFVTGLLWLGLFRVDPETSHVLLEAARLSHVPEERSGRRMVVERVMRMLHMHGIDVWMVVAHGHSWVAGPLSVVERVRPAVHLARGECR